jgi:pyruvate,water dikinase
VVQALVEPAVAGVLFTRDPVTRADQIVVEATWGLGEALVSGLVTPDHYVLSPAGELLSQTIGDKDLAIVPTDEGTAEVEVEPARRLLPCLDSDQLAALVDLAHACERLGGGPQDVEWALANGRLVLLQSRPITR